MTDEGPISTRRRFLLASLATFSLGAMVGGGGALYWASDSRYFSDLLNTRRRAERAALRARVLPRQGYRTSVSFRDSIMRLVAAGAISPEKFERLYARKEGLPNWVKGLFESPSDVPIRISARTAPYLLNLLWPLGLANRAAFNLESPIEKNGVARFASTAGWTLGAANKGAVYFNKVQAVRLDETQEQNALAVARNIFRPCCNNSTFFQDCNHGSALLGLLELAAAQDVEPEELYRMALAANAYWYPSQYIEAAIYFEEIAGIPWREVSPSVVLGKQYSSASGWRNNIHVPLSRGGALLGAGAGGGVSCAV